MVFSSGRCLSSSICSISYQVLQCHHCPTTLCSSTTLDLPSPIILLVVSMFHCPPMILFSSTSPRNLSWKNTVLLLRFGNFQGKSHSSVCLLISLVEVNQAL